MKPENRVPITMPEILEETTKIITFYEEVLDTQNSFIEKLFEENNLLRKRTKRALFLLRNALLSIRSKYMQ